MALHLGRIIHSLLRRALRLKRMLPVQYGSTGGKSEIARIDRNFGSLALHLKEILLPKDGRCTTMGVHAMTRDPTCIVGKVLQGLRGRYPLNTPGSCLHAFGNRW